MNTVNKGSDTKCLASGNKEYFLKIASRSFKKGGHITEEATWGTPREKVVEQNT